MDLSIPANRAQLVKRIEQQVDSYCQETFNDGFRKHLGASLMGHECARYLWLSFRWCAEPNFDGRMYRLFNRGHREEPCINSYLRGIGCEVWEVDENGKQFRITDCDGHFGGSCDGIVKLPESWGIDEPLLLEEKTSNDVRFNELSKHCVAVKKPRHFDQMCCYAEDENFQIKYALYWCVNKNNDDIYLEIVELDWKRGRFLKEKAGDIIKAPFPPPKCSSSPAYHTCKQCEFPKICFEKETPCVNCRSCSHAKPVKDGKWFCDLKGEIDYDIIPVGCRSHRPII